MSGFQQMREEVTYSPHLCHAGKKLSDGTPDGSPASSGGPLTVVAQPTTRPYAAHLTPEAVADIERELDALRQSVIESRGARDAAYIRRVIRVQRLLELSGRVVLLRSRSKKMWLLGTASLSLAKILENMEIGHNVLHGQWDW